MTSISPPSYTPPWWCQARHLQTIWAVFRRKRLTGLERERLETPDGDFIDLDWLPGKPESPILLVVHGLEGSVDSHYVGGLFRLAAARGWRAALLYFRSCSGELNRLPRFYHSGETGDLDHVIRTLGAREPKLRLGAVGVSIGGNVLMKWLGEQGADAPAALVGAVGISVPFNLMACAHTMDRRPQRLLYTGTFMRSLRQKVTAKARVYPGFVDLDAVRRARTFAAYDRAVTAPLHGFADEEDYWRRASSLPYLTRVRRPTLPPAVRAEFVPHGGHVGFVEGRPWRATSWAERRAVDFLATVFDTRAVC